MTRSTSMTFLGGTAAVLLAGVAVAAGGTGVTTATAASTTAAAHHATVRVATAGNLGKVLVDSQGRTLYLFKKDAGHKSACFGACAAAWPPLRASGKPTVGSGAKASMLSTIKRSDGRSQVTYNGHPLYRFVMDRKPGDAKGEGLTAFDGSWFAVSRTGHQVSKPSSSGGGSTGSGTGSTGY